MFNQTFQALLKEAQFTKEVLGAGATQIREANYARKGAYFLAFTSLSTGLERMGKLCLMLDYYIDNNSQFPDFKYLKNDIGHRLDVLYTKSLDVKYKRSIRHSYCQDLDDEIHKNIMKILSNFAVGDRYSNINLLVDSKQKSDPIKSWYETVDKNIYEKRVTQKKKAKIENNAKLLNLLAGHVISVSHISETGSEISNVEEASVRTGVQEAVAPYRQLYVIQIIRFWVELLYDLQYKAMSMNNHDIPFFSDIFGDFFNSDSYIRTRKTWD